MSKAELSLCLGSEKDRVSGLLAYRCPNGHIFLTLPQVQATEGLLMSTV
jgi:hypothetical protein